MKIADMKIYSVRNAMPNRGGPYFIFVKLTTDNNIDGFGEIYGVPFRPKVVEKMSRPSRKDVAWLYCQFQKNVETLRNKSP